MFASVHIHSTTVTSRMTPKGSRSAHVPVETTFCPLSRSDIMTCPKCQHSLRIWRLYSFPVVKIKRQYTSVLERQYSSVLERQYSSVFVGICQLTSTYCPRMSQYTSTYVSIRQYTSVYVSIREYVSAYVNIRQHTSTYVNILLHTSSYVRICQYTSTYVSDCRIENKTKKSHFL